jgi:hypothetical protein
MSADMRKNKHVVSSVFVCFFFGGGGQALRVFFLIGISVSETEKATQRCNNKYAFPLELYNVLIFGKYYYVQTVKF